MCSVARSPVFAAIHQHQRLEVLARADVPVPLVWHVHRHQLAQRRKARQRRQPRRRPRSGSSPTARAAPASSAIAMKPRRRRLWHRRPQMYSMRARPAQRGEARRLRRWCPGTSGTAGAAARRCRASTRPWRRTPASRSGEEPTSGARPAPVIASWLLSTFRPNSPSRPASCASPRSVKGPRSIRKLASGVELRESTAPGRSRARS